MLQKLTQEQLSSLLGKFCAAVLAEPSLKIREIILFGSYARGDADEESDVDIMVLTDIPREELRKVDRFLVEKTDPLDWGYSVVVSPVTQNYDFFRQWSKELPFYCNVDA